MNQDTTDGRGRRRAVALSATAVLTLLAAACGGGPHTDGTGAPRSRYQQALVYAQCMRSHGEPRFPNPDSQGNFLLTGPAVGPLNAPPYLTANRACQHLLPRTAPVTTAQKRRNISQALKFSACMRGHGIPKFPDPLVGSGGAAIGFRMSGIDQNSPQFQAAQQACRRFAANGSRW